MRFTLLHCTVKKNIQGKDHMHYSIRDAVRSSDSEPSQEYDIPNIPGNYFFSQLNETYRETLEDYFAEQKKREQQKVRHKSLTSFMPQKLFEMIDLMDRT